jgi:hypothetical protein
VLSEKPGQRTRRGRWSLRAFRTLVDLRVVKEFHETVVEAIRLESPATARRIVGRLKERRALRPSVDLPALTGDPNGDLA